MNKKVHLTDQFVSNLRPQSGRYAILDDTVVGLQVRVAPSGVKTFYLRKKVNGRTVSVRIGRYPDEVKTPTTARELALPLLSRMAQGVNPNSEKKKARSQECFASLFKLFMELHAKPNKKSWRGDDDIYRLHIPRSIKVKPLSDLTRIDIKNLHISIGEKVGKVTANRVLGLMNSVFHFAINELGMVSLHHPCAGMKRFKEYARKNRLMPDQVGVFFDVVDKLKKTHPQTANVILLTLYTGARSGNVMDMEWGELDFVKSTWTIPEDKMKNGDSFTIPMIPETIEIVTGIDRVNGNPFVFPSPSKHGRPTTRAAHSTAWRVARANTPIDGLTFHDLRRTHGSWMADMGFSKDLLKASLGHKSDSANDVYTHVSTEPVRKVKEKTVARILEFKKVS